jgi:signal transduction histidine kinase
VQLWEVFLRTLEARREGSGAGIGLFVSKELIHAMGGRVWAKPAEQAAGGAEFGFWLPAVEVADED